MVFSFFLLVAIIIWLLKALEKNYTSEIDYPVRYRNFPEGKTLIGELPDHLELNVYAHGYVLLQHKISSRYLPLVISVNSFSLKELRDEDGGFYFLETRYLKDYIDKQLSAEFEILEVKPDTLVFPFAEVIEKKLPVQPAFDYQLEKQMIIKQSPLIQPDSVMVTGPAYLLDTLSAVNTRDRDLGLISGDDNFEIPLKSIRHTTFNPEEVKVSFEVERFTEKILSVPVNVAGAPDSLQVITFPRNISLSCQVGLSNYEKIQADMFKATVNYSDIEGGQTRLPVSLTRTPEFVRAIKFSPRTVEYLIRK
jgi:hypothetical protein